MGTKTDIYEKAIRDMKATPEYKTVCETNEEDVKVVCRRPHYEGQDHWCFSCRKKTKHEWRLVVEPIYGPSREVSCLSCNTLDGDLFPGRYRDPFDWSFEDEPFFSDDEEI